MFICLLLSQIINTGMLSTARYGIKSFKFIFNVPGNFSKLFYFVIPLLSADLYYRNSFYKRIMIFLGIIVWISTLRSRAFAFAIVYFILLFFCLRKKQYNNKDRKIKFKIRYIIIIAVILIPICWKPLMFYFNSTTQARAILLRYGIVTMKDYFPLGSGFGTFGSDVAITNYSKLYTKYEFYKYYGMSSDYDHFLNDNYWPMIFGQFGFIGTILVFIILEKFFRVTLRNVRTNKYFYLAVLCANMFLLLSSVASKSYSEYSSICVFMLLGLLVQRERKNLNEENSGGKKNE